MGWSLPGLGPTTDAKTQHQAPAFYWQTACGYFLQVCLRAGPRALESKLFLVSLLAFPFTTLICISISSSHKGHVLGPWLLGAEVDHLESQRGVGDIPLIFQSAVFKLSHDAGLHFNHFLDRYFY